VKIRNKYNGDAGDGHRIYRGGGGGSEKSTTTQELPAELKPLASAYANKAINLSNQGYTPYTGDRYADLNNVQNQALGQTIDRAVNGSQTMNNAENALNQQIQGGQGNPYLDSMVQRAQDSVKSNFNTSAINSGSFGNSGVQEAYTKQLGDVASQMYGQAYDGDQARQMQAIGMAPTFGNQAYADADKLMTAGQVLQDQSQQDKDFAYQQYQEKQNLPYQQLAAMSGVFGTNLGNSASTKTSGGGGK
jgi:hypothetical protein